MELMRVLGLTKKSSIDERKAALRDASHRWHPDKFSQKFGDRLAAADTVKAT